MVCDECYSFLDRVSGRSRRDRVFCRPGRSEILFPDVRLSGGRERCTNIPGVELKNTANVSRRRIVEYMYNILDSRIVEVLVSRFCQEAENNLEFDHCISLWVK